MDTQLNPHTRHAPARQTDRPSRSIVPSDQKGDDERKKETDTQNDMQAGRQADRQTAAAREESQLGGRQGHTHTR